MPMADTGEHQAIAEEKPAPDTTVAEVAHMLSEWEDSDELTTVLAHRLVATIFRLDREFR